jgi:hypothetical protein
LLPDHGIDLPKLAVQLGAADAQRHWLSNGGLFLPEPLAFHSGSGTV